MSDSDLGMDFANGDPNSGDENFQEDVNFENDIDMGGKDFSSNRNRGRGNFGKGQSPRMWMGPPPGGAREGPPQRFRGRGFGGPPPLFGRGSGGRPPMFGRGGGPRNAPNFNQAPNFNGGPGQSWNGPQSGPPPLMSGQFAPPSLMGGPNVSGGPPNQQQQGGPPQFPPAGGANGNADLNSEIWVETKTAEGKSYYYHARTRETTWSKPEGANVKVITQTQVEAMAQAANSNIVAQNTSTAAQAALAQANITNKQDEAEDVTDPAKAVVGSGNNSQVPPAMMQGPPPGLPFGPPFGMPPPGFANPWPGPGQPGWPPGAAPPPWTMPPGLLPVVPSAMAAIDEAAVMSKVDPEIIAKATEWTEHKAPDGRFYYHNAKKGESVWEKPQAMKDLETAKLAAAQGISTHPITENIAPPQATDTGKVNSAVPPVASIAPPANVIPTPVPGVDMAKEEKDMGDEKIKKLQEEIRKKKEEEEKAKEAKAQDKSRPVSSTPVPGTPWCVVWTGDGRVFFYNPSSRTSVWERPEELLKRSDVDKLVATTPDALTGITTKEEPKSPAKSKRDSDDSDSEPEIPTKKAKKEDVPVTAAPPINTPNKKIDIGKEAAIEAEVRAAKERAVIPLETRIKLFKEMLTEKQVSAFSTWEKELHKIVFDSRYLLLTSKERKQVFEKYVKERAEEERREKRNKLREKKDAFRKLMSESHLHGKSSFSDFAQKFAKDDRFKGVDKMRERESLFNEYLIEVRKKEKDEKNQRREVIKKEFFAMLREHSDIDRHSHWSDVKRKVDSDARYKAVESHSLKENWFRDYCKMLKEEKKRAKEKDREHKREKEKHKKKDKDKERKRDKERESKDKSKKEEVIEDEAHESTVREEMDENEHDSEDDSKVKEEREKDRQARAEASMRKREEEVQRTLATHMRDRDKEREQHKRDEARQHFNALLVDLVRNSDLNWKEVKRILRKDHRWDLADSLSREDKEKLYGEHVEQLIKKKRQSFRELLDETNEVTLISTWKEIKKMIRDDPRYTKFASSERCEREFKDYLKDKLVLAKGQFKELLQETKLITHRSLQMLRENQNHMQEIEEILKNDKRFLTLDYIAQERTQLILNYLEELDRRGPPPPPTASEPNRRLK